MSLLMAPQSTQPKKPQRGGPDAQEQSSFQHKKRKASRLGESYGPHKALLPLHRTTTSQSLVRDRSLAVVGFRVSGRWWWWKTSSPKTQAVNHEKGVEAPGTESLKSQRL